MAAALIDTSILVGMARKEEVARKALERLDGDEAVICDIVLAEMVSGARNRDEAERWYEALVANYHLLPFTMEVSLIIRDLVRAAWQHRGAHLSDHLIAATAIAHDCPLLTLNRKDFERIKGLKLL